MFDRVIVDVVQVIFHIQVIADNVVPESLLPEFHGLRRWQSLNGFVCFCIICFERVHDLAEVAFLFWLNDHVKMVRQKTYPNMEKGWNVFTVRSVSRSSAISSGSRKIGWRPSTTWVMNTAAPGM
jgi:hypothetical protein